MATKFTTVTSLQAKNTLVRRFVGLADNLRDLLTRFGLRTYKVSLVTIEWTGGKRGKGTPVIVKGPTPILPTPKITAMDSLAEELQSVGLEEVGTIELSQISGTFTEEQLRGFSPEGDPIEPAQEFFYEVEFFPNNGLAQKRRFYLKGVPTYFPGRLQWQVRLEKDIQDRDRNGDVGD